MLVINDRGRDGKALLVLGHRVGLRGLGFITHFSLIYCSQVDFMCLLPPFPMPVKGDILCNTYQSLVTGMPLPELLLAACTFSLRKAAHLPAAAHCLSFSGHLPPLQ